MAELAKDYSKSDPELKLDIVDRLLKYEALKLKAQQGSMGSGFDDPEEGA